MSWAGIANNQEVTRDNLQDAVNTGVLLSKATITGTGSQCVTKSNVNTFVYVDSGETTWATYGNGQLVPKSVITNAAVVKYTGTYSATSCAAACTSTDIRTIYTTGALNTGSYCFTDAALTTRAANGYYDIPTLGYCYFLDQFKTVNGYCVSRTAQTFYTLALYGKMGATTWPSNVKIQYGYGSSGPWIDAFTISSLVCPSTASAAISFCSGATVYLQAVRTDNGNAVYFNTATTATCPSNTAVTCLPTITMSANTTRAITIYVSGNNFLAC